MHDKLPFFIHIQLLLQAIPYRRDFTLALKVDSMVSDEQLCDDIRETLVTVKNNIDALYQYYRDTGQNLNVYSNVIQFRE